MDLISAVVGVLNLSSDLEYLELQFDGSPIRDAHVIDLSAAVQASGSLSTLEFSCDENAVADRALASFAAALRHQRCSLQRFYLICRTCEISNAGAQDLASALAVNQSLLMFGFF